MKNLLKSPIISLSPINYSKFILLLVPILSFISGIVIDLYSPSLPALAEYFQQSPTVMKNSVTLTMFGLGLGSLIFGALIDSIGYKFVICFGMIGFASTSLLTIYSMSINEFLILRFLQGALGATAFLVARTLLIKHFSGKKYLIGMTYAAIGFGSGPVIAPFIGAYLQYHFNWQANFIAYIAVGLAILCVVILFLDEPSQKNSRSLMYTVRSYKTIFQHPRFLFLSFALGMVVTQNMLFPTIGPFLVNELLNASTLVYGRCALAVGLGYLCGSLTNRLLLHYLEAPQLLMIGLIVFFISLCGQKFLAMGAGLNPWTLTIPIALMTYSLGFFYSNITGIGLKIFPENPGIATATQGFLMILIGSFNNFIISFFTFDSLLKINLLYTILFLSQFSIIFMVRKLKIIFFTANKSP